MKRVKISKYRHFIRYIGLIMYPNVRLRTFFCMFNGVEFNHEKKKTNFIITCGKNIIC